MIEFDVIGELHSNPGHLLLLDADGQCYEYDIRLDELVAIDPEQGDWVIDLVPPGQVLVVAPEEQLVAS